MSDVEFYVNSLSKKQLAEAYVHLRSRLERLEEKSARLERCAKKWAHTVVIPSCDGFRCLCCQRLVLATHYNENRSEVEKLQHAHDCDAAHILGLEREVEK